jgi:hypothetical protein
MHKLEQNGIWYYMDAGYVHSATNFGRRSRIQLVIRKLLRKNDLTNPVPVIIKTTLDNINHARFLFDNTISPWLNEANKIGYISNFSYTPKQVTFDIEHRKIESLKNILPTEFVLE